MNFMWRIISKSKKIEPLGSIFLCYIVYILLVTLAKWEHHTKCNKECCNDEYESLCRSSCSLSYLSWSRSWLRCLRLRWGWSWSNCGRESIWDTFVVSISSSLIPCCCIYSMRYYWILEETNEFTIFLIWLSEDISCSEFWFEELHLLAWL